MKMFAFLMMSFLAFTACQKSLESLDGRERNSTIITARDTGILSTDPLVMSGDSLTYEVITEDPGGWYGVWNDSSGNLVCNPSDSITYGSPVYNKSGWRYTFVCPSKPFQALISVAAKSYSKDITANLYKNGKLIKTSTNDAMKGVAKLLLNASTDTLRGTATDPVLTYQILVTDQDTAKFEHDAWSGQWNNSNGIPNDMMNPILTFFARPSGWKYSFKPSQLPFTMHVAASPYTKNGAKVTINFYVNGRLVKSAAVTDWIYDMNYIVR